jgi:hypothetical protein
MHKHMLAPRDGSFALTPSGCRVRGDELGRTAELSNRLYFPSAVRITVAERRLPSSA